LFLYQVTHKLLGSQGDTGADLRSTLKALVRCGVPPERYWPYNVEDVDKEPEAFLYSFADRYRSIRYVRLDGRNSTGHETLLTVKSFLTAGFPAVFGFSVPGSISLDADVPYRPTFDIVRGGQAAVAIGYDDRRTSSTRGALLFRNSWGGIWGDGGYGWLPYAYVEQQLATDFWIVLRADWLGSNEFTRPQNSQ
jgi:C1A family cysteine protease